MSKKTKKPSNKNHVSIKEDIGISSKSSSADKGRTGPNISKFIITIAAFVIVIAGAKAASSIITPVLLAALLAFICSIPQASLIKKKLHPALATLLSVLGFLLIFVLLGWLVGSSVDDFMTAAPTYQAQLKRDTVSTVKWLQEKGIDVSGKVVLDYFNPSAAVDMASRILSATTGLLTNALLILVIMIFILTEITSISSRLKKLSGEFRESEENLSAITKGLYKYLIIKTGVSLLTGFVLWCWLKYLGVSYANLWGVLVFFLNFIPNIGSIIAGILPVFVALVEGGPSTALAVIAGFIVANLVIGTFLEPRYMGEGLGISTLVIFLSLAFWGWVFGPVGMLLSVPLTMICKIALQSSEDLWWMALLFGDISD